MIDRFYDISVLTYKVPEFDGLSLNQKKFVFYLSLAAAWGRDIILQISMIILSVSMRIMEFTITIMK